MRIPYDAMRVHGITDAMVRGAPSAAEAFEALRARAAGRPAVMHNAAFDLRMFAQDAVRCRAEPPLVHALCTMKLARRVFVGVGSYGLGRLVHVLGINEDPTHRALTDARATARLYELIRAELAARG
jgi:DNA polymerase-3 subunit epsilon